MSLHMTKHRLLDKLRDRDNGTEDTELQLHEAVDSGISKIQDCMNFEFAACL